MAEYTAKRSWLRWAGTHDLLEQALRSAAESLRRWKPDAPVRCSISVVLPQITMRFDSIDDFHRVSEFDFVQARSIRAALSSQATVLGNPSVEIVAASDYPQAVSLEVEGDDRDRVDGLRATISDILDRGRKKPPWLNSNGRFTLGLILGATSFVVLAIALRDLASTLRWLPKGNEGLVVWPLIVLAGIIGVGIGRGFYWLLPDLELLPEGGRTRYQRFRAAVFLVVLSVVGAIIAAPIIDAISQGH